MAPCSDSNIGTHDRGGRRRDDRVQNHSYALSLCALLHQGATDGCGVVWYGRGEGDDRFEIMRLCRWWRSGDDVVQDFWFLFLSVSFEAVLA
ncbi:Hypothetical predicted protein [Olea europaea subsp. europaea]|uniref:Uncharacterized protein n=1 Tax=Olea europaea subsp. europaea TaxID=158383 RepID=A0A8S0TLL1_OLEEU|nr:Hypothetical predicted protein [Olea europaea subsp. europaea]